MSRRKHLFKPWIRKLPRSESFTLAKVTELRQQLGKPSKASSRISTTRTPKRFTERNGPSRRSIPQTGKVCQHQLSWAFTRFSKSTTSTFRPTPARSFTCRRLHAQAWVRGDYSDLVVRIDHHLFHPAQRSSRRRNGRCLAVLFAQHHKVLGQDGRRVACQVCHFTTSCPSFCKRRRLGIAIRK